MFNQDWAPLPERRGLGVLQKTMRRTNEYGPGHQIGSLVLPLIVILVVPFLLVVRTNPFGIQFLSKLPYLQIPVGCLLLGIGLLLLVVTIRLFIKIGKGTLAPWDPTNKLVTEGVYGYVRNPNDLWSKEHDPGRVNSARFLDRIGLVLCRCYSKHYLFQTFRRTWPSKKVWK